MSGLFESLSGAGGIRAQGKSEQNIANFNAEVERQKAIGERAKAGFAQKRQAKKGLAIKSALEAKLGAAGGLGSPVAGDLAAEQAGELELENLLLGYEGEVLAQQHEAQAELDLLQGKLAKQKGKAGARAANVQFGMQLLTLGKAGTGGGAPAGGGTGMAAAHTGGGGSGLTAGNFSA